MRPCNTNVARSMGYLPGKSTEETIYGTVTVMGPREGKMRSYHQSGMSSKELFLAQRKAAKEAGLQAEALCRRLEFRL